MAQINPTVLRMAEDWYTRRLIELNPILLMTPSMVAKLNFLAEGLRKGMLATESNPVWHLPVSIHGDGMSATRFVVVLDTSSLADGSK